MTGDALNVTLWVAGLLASIAIGYFFLVRARTELRPVYVVAGNTVVKADKERDIEVLHAGESVPVVTRSVVAFWNAGRGPIRRSDFVKTHPLVMKLPDKTRFLDYRLVATTRDEIDFTPTIRPSGDVRLDFSFLNYRDGGVVEILHTGDDPFALTVEGAIVGVNGPPKRIRSPLYDDAFGTRVIFPLTIVFFLASLVNAAISRSLDSMLLIPLTTVGVWAGIHNWRTDRRRIPAPLRGSVSLPRP